MLNNKMLRIYLGSDHAGFPLKTAIKQYLTKLNLYDVVDVGTEQKLSCHYPVFAQKVAKLIQPEDRGILVCGSGIGIGIAANKCGLSCSTAYDEYSAAECGRHFKVMALGSRVVTIQIAGLMIQEFLKASSYKKQTL